MYTQSIIIIYKTHLSKDLIIILNQYDFGEN